MRVQVNLSDEMCASVDKYAQKMGVSRSALCSMLIGQGVMSYDKTMNIVEQLGDKIGDKLLAEKALQEVGRVAKNE